MLERILKMYIASQLGHVYSPMPHLFGPPGCGKSTVVADAAKLLGVKLHIINVSRISPLELEGVQMPVEENTKLRLLTATFWTQLKDGDILLLDEFLRAFPEVYNGLLDILTSREVGGFKLPNVFIIGASNSTVAYDPALEDRLLHLPVPDIRKSRLAREAAAKRLVEHMGLLPTVVGTSEMTTLIDTELIPTYHMLDELGSKVAAKPSKGLSERHLIGMVKLREIRSASLMRLIDVNNILAQRQSKPEYVVLPDGTLAGLQDLTYEATARELLIEGALTPIQRVNTQINLQLIGLEKARVDQETGETHDDDIFVDGV